MTKKVQVQYSSSTVRKQFENGSATVRRQFAIVGAENLQKSHGIPPPASTATVHTAASRMSQHLEQVQQQKQTVDSREKSPVSPCKTSEPAILECPSNNHQLSTPVEQSIRHTQRQLIAVWAQGKRGKAMMAAATGISLVCDRRKPMKRQLHYTNLNLELICSVCI